MLCFWCDTHPLPCSNTSYWRMLNVWIGTASQIAFEKDKDTRRKLHQKYQQCRDVPVLADKFTVPVSEVSADGEAFSGYLQIFFCIPMLPM